MAQQQGISQPGPFGGLMRYDEEYKSKFMITPGHVVAGIIAIVILVAALKIFFPAVELGNTIIPTSNSIPIGGEPSGFWMSLFG